MLKNDTIKFNRDRGLLETFDPALELKMLSEEAAEFYKAETFAHQLAEYADFLFVWDGTKAKWGSQIVDKATSLELAVNYYRVLTEWAESIISDMKAVLMDHTELCAGDIHSCITMARCEVVYCNSKKGTKKVGGKVQKNENHIDPVALIQGNLTKRGIK